MLSSYDQRAESSLRAAMAAYGVDRKAMNAEEGPSSARRICAALSRAPFGHDAESDKGCKVRITSLSPDTVADILSAICDELLWGTQTETMLSEPLHRVLAAYRAYHDENIPPEETRRLVDLAIGGSDGR